MEKQEPPREEEGDLDGLHDLVQNVALKPSGDPPPLEDDQGESGKSGGEKDKASRCPGDVGGVGHRDPDLRLSEGRRVVDPVSGHADDMAFLLKLPDEKELVFRKDSREEIAVVRKG